jgi:hypothetical protein
MRALISARGTRPRSARLAALRAAVRRRIGIDVRALAVLRVALGALLLADLALRARSLRAFYTDAGVLPRAVLSARNPALARFSLHALSGAAAAQWLLFALAAAFALALLVGYRTRLATLGSLLLLASLHARNPLVLNGGDALLRRLLLWGLFLPLGERLSVDALRAAAGSRDSADARERVAGVASAALLSQVVLVYGVDALLKHRSPLWIRGNAVRYVFSLDQFTVLLGERLAGFPALLRLANWFWLGLLSASVLLLLLTGRRRTLLVSLFVTAHFGMALTMRLGLFPLISVAALLPFLPPQVWDGLAARVPAGSTAVDRWGGRRLPAAPAGPWSLTPPSLPPRLRRTGRRAASVLAAALLVLALGWNATALGYVDAPPAVERTVDPADYRWDMFAPSPPRADAWYVAPGQLASGERVDAFRGGPVRWHRPPDVSATYPTARWRKYLLDVWRSGDPRLEAALGAHLCRRWNRDHRTDLVAVRVVVVAQPTRLAGPEPTRRHSLAARSCPDPGG